MSWNLKGWSGADAKEIEPAYLGNGVIGLRINPEDLTGGQMMLSGFWAENQSAQNSVLAQIPSPLQFRLLAGRRRYFSFEMEGQELDYVTATLASRGRATYQKNVIQCEVRHWISRSSPSLAVCEFTLTPEQDGYFCLQHDYEGSAFLAELESAEAFNKPIEGEAEVDMTWVTSGGASHAAIKVSAMQTSGACVETQRNILGKNLAQLELSWPEAKAGEPIKVVFYMTAVTTAQHSQPVAQCSRLHRWSSQHSFDELRSAHERNWADVWRGRVIIEGDDEAQAVVDGSMYHLFSSASPSSLTGMAPLGLSHTLYNGHVFWDNETWTLPPFMLLEPDTAKASFRYRINGLQSAQRNAALYGFKGAMFPWESGRFGEEVTPPWALSGPMQQHISADIAFAAWQLQASNGDEDWFHEVTWPLVKNVADWITSRVVETERGFEVRHVMGADEHSSNVSNNAHTNLIFRKVLEIATEAAKLAGRKAPRVWLEIAERIVIPRDAETGLIKQQDEWAEGHIAKQADTLLTVYPLGILDDAEDIQKVVDAHVPKDPEHNCEVAMGDQIHAVAAARIGERELAKLFFHRGWEPYWIDTWGMFAEMKQRTPGCFITGHGGVLQAVLMGFTGLQLDRDGLVTHRVSMPEGWSRIICERIILGGVPHRLVASQGALAELTPL